MKDLKPNAPVEDQVDAIDIAAHIERRLIYDIHKGKITIF
jgi:hypothetical protein